MIMQTHPRIIRGLISIRTPMSVRVVLLFVLTRVIKFLFCGVVIAVFVVDAEAHFYHICFTTETLLKWETRSLTQVHDLTTGWYFCREEQS